MGETIPSYAIIIMKSRNDFASKRERRYQRMSFLRRKPCSRKKSALSLQTFNYVITHTHQHKSGIPVSDLHSQKNNSNSFLKRMSFGISSLRKNGGSLVVEASIAIPIFLFAILSVLSFSEILRLQMKMNSAMQQTAKELAVYGYAEKEMLGEGVAGLNVPVSMLFSETYVRSHVLSQFSDEYLQNSPANGNNFLFLGSKIMENDRIELRCSYYVKPFFALSDKAGFLTQSTAVARAFTGYDNLSSQGYKQKEEYVYVTETGRVYHTDRGCHYLDLSIKTTDEKSLSGLRNTDGSKYKACPLCAKNAVGAITYITDYGECYHYDLMCSGLKRTVHTVLLSETGGLSPCSKCGK